VQYAQQEGASSGAHSKIVKELLKILSGKGHAKQSFFKRFAVLLCFPNCYVSRTAKFSELLLRLLRRLLPWKGCALQGQQQVLLRLLVFEGTRRRRLGKAPKKKNCYVSRTGKFPELVSFPNCYVSRTALRLLRRLLLCFSNW